MNASFRVLDLSVESEVIVEFDSEVFYTSVFHLMTRLNMTIWPAGR
jgi:hypothetical protein